MVFPCLPIGMSDRLEPRRRHTWRPRRGSATVSDGSRPEASDCFPVNRCAAGDEHATPLHLAPHPRLPPELPAPLTIPTHPFHSAIAPRTPPDNPARPTALIQTGTPLAPDGNCSCHTGRSGAPKLEDEVPAGGGTRG